MEAEERGTQKQKTKQRQEIAVERGVGGDFSGDDDGNAPR